MMKAVDVCIRQVNVNPPVVELHLADNTIRSFPLKNIHEYVNQKPPSMVDLAIFQNMIDADHWFSRTGRKPTLRILAEEYLRSMQTDLDCPLTILKGSFMLDGATSASDRMGLARWYPQAR